MRGTEKGKTLILSALICTIIFAILGIQDAKSINAETPEDTANKQVKEITIVTVTPKKVEAQEYIDFDLRNLSIVRKEGEDNGVINSGTHSDGESAGEPATATEDSGRDESDAQGNSDDNSGDEYSVGETDGSEMAESGQEQWSESEDIVSEDRTGESMPELSAEESYDAEYENGDDGQYEMDSGLNDDEGWVYYENCRITFYDTGACCCGEWASGYTASGTLATVGRTVATGEDLPFGTEVMINGQVYIVEDRGVEPGQIDVLVSDHETALAMGMYYTDVYVRYPN
jgi:hypothetical protein